MSKRVANTRDRTARFGRVRIGWRKQKMLTELGKIDKAERKGGVEEEMQQKFDEYKTRAKKALGRFFPRVHRTQARS